jgi:hypothetical protein
MKFLKRQISATAIFIVVLVLAPLNAQEPVVWKTGNDFRRQLELPLGFRWKSNPIRPALGNLGRNQRVAVWLDRRVDPGHPTDISVVDVPLDVAFRQIAESLRCGVSYVDSIAYVGPMEVTSKLATLAEVKREEVNKRPAPARARFQQKKAWAWEALSTPKNLLQQLAAEADIEIENFDRLPHDLWPAGDLPAMTLTDRITLVLAGFDLSFDIGGDGSTIRLVQMPESVSLERLYTPRGSLATAATKVTNNFPDVTIERAERQLKVSGSYEDHQLIARFLRGESIRKRDVPAAEKRYDLRVTNQPIGAIIKLVAEREKLTVKVDPALQSKLQQRISLDVKQATLHELLEQTLKSARLDYRLNSDVLELRSGGD